MSLLTHSLLRLLLTALLITGLLIHPLYGQSSRTGNTQAGNTPSVLIPDFPLQSVAFPDVESAGSSHQPDLATWPAYRGHTARIYVMPEPLIDVPPLWIQGSYTALQQTLQQRDLLFWHVPLWTLVVNLLSALVLMLVSLRRSGLPLLRWLLACALTANFYLLPALIPVPAWLTLPGVALWIWLLTRLLASLKHPQGADKVLSAAIMLILLLVVMDAVILLTGWQLNAHPGMVLQLVPYGQMAGVIAALYFLSDRHAQTQRALAQLNLSLDQRVRVATAELQERYANLKQDALDAAGLTERRGIYQSIHEDLSDKLLQLIYSASTAETADLARSALAELRDSHQLGPDDIYALDDVLADIRSECQTRCDQAGLQLQWQQAGETGQISLSSRQRSALSRTLREAFSNLLKHAQADCASVNLQLTPDKTLKYQVSDNGRGMAFNRRPGRGLVNMHNRIRELGGELTVPDISAGNGVTLIFSLPLAGQRNDRGSP